MHSQKRNPVTHCKVNLFIRRSYVFTRLQDPDAFWDFLSLRKESTHQVMFLFSDRGTPDGYRHMNGYGSHTYKLVNKEGAAVWCKFHFKVLCSCQDLT